MIFQLNSKPQVQRNYWRKVWLKWHLYLGLSFGLVFVLAGVTGSLLVFYLEIDEIINPQLQISNEQLKYPVKTYDELYQAIQAQHPERNGAWRLEVPRNANAMLMARYYQPIETQHLKFAPLIVWVNPYTAKVVSSRFWGEFVMTWIYNLHYQLLLDETGKTIMGIIGFILLIPLLTGIYLWWPKAKKVKSALTIKRNSSKTRFVYDLHKTNGVYSLVFLLILLITGSLLELPDFFNPGISRISPLFESKNTASEYRLNAQKISLDQAARIAIARFPMATLRWLETPKNNLGSYKISLYQAGEPSLRFPKTSVWINQYNGQILSVRDPKKNSAGDVFLSWLHPLHSGEIAGTIGRIIVFLCGLVPCILYITGVIRWRQKVKNKKLTKKGASNNLGNL